RFERDGAERPPLLTDRERWRTVALFDGFARIYGMDDTARFFRTKGDPKREALSLFPPGEGEPKGSPVGSLRLVPAADGSASLEGTFGGHAIKAALQARDTSQFPLMNRGFHWISEYPYNR